jgi:hypothetical protein
MSAKKSISKDEESLVGNLIIMNEIKPSAKALKKYLAILRNSLSAEQRILLESIPGLRINGHNGNGNGHGHGQTVTPKAIK